MKIFLVTDAGDRAIVAPDNVTSAAECEGDCPACFKPLRVVGKGRRVVNDRYYAADGHCAACLSHVGEIQAHPDTLFGIEEDERVLNGRARVY